MAHNYVYIRQRNRFAVGKREWDQERHCTGKFDVRGFQVVGLWNSHI